MFDFEFYINFSRDFLSSLEAYSVEFFDFLTSPLASANPIINGLIELLGVNYPPYYFLFSNGLFLILTYGIVRFVLDILPLT